MNAIIDKLIENDDADFDMKELEGAGPVEFCTDTLRKSSYHPDTTYVYAALPGKFKEHRGTVRLMDDGTYAITYLNDRGGYVNIPVASKQDGIDAIIDDFTGASRLTDSKDLASVKKLLSELTEDDEDDIGDMKEFGGGALSAIISSLETAGFAIAEADIVDDLVMLNVTWPIPTYAAYIGGAKRLEEALGHFFPVRHYERKVTREGEGTNRIARAIIHHRLEDDLSLWKVKAAKGFSEDDSRFVNILFNDEVVGEAYCQSGKEEGQRLRDEMAQLHKISPFDPRGWPQEGDAFGTGPALEWWRINRSKLGRYAQSNEYYYNRGLVRQPAGI